MSYKEAMEVVRKQGGANITTNVGTLIGGLRRSDTNNTQNNGSVKWSFWELRDYKAVIFIIDLDGRDQVTGLCHWTTPDFDDLRHRQKTMHGAFSLAFDPSKKTIAWKASPGEGSRPNSQGGANGGQPFGSETNWTL
jgi:hypothetical protein